MILLFLGLVSVAHQLVSVSFVAQKKKRMNVKCRKVNSGGKKKDLEIRVEYLSV